MRLWYIKPRKPVYRNIFLVRKNYFNNITHHIFENNSMVNSDIYIYIYIYTL